jgi:hypothetical protein
MKENKLEQILFSSELTTDDYKNFTSLVKKKVKNIKIYISQTIL